MKRRLAVVLAVAACTPLRAEEPRLPEGFTALFNGKNLAGWKVHDGKMDVWGAEKGVLFCDTGGGWLLTEEEFADVELRCEFRWTKEGGNSGVGLRVPRRGAPHVEGMEIQLIDDEHWEAVHKFKLADYQHTGSLYDVKPAAKLVNKPVGEWNRVRIVCQGRRVAVEINGAKVNDVNLDDFKKSKGDTHPGILREKGSLGFQSYNFRVEFRNVWIKKR